MADEKTPPCKVEAQENMEERFTPNPHSPRIHATHKFFHRIIDPAYLFDRDREKRDEIIKDYYDWMRSVLEKEAENQDPGTITQTREFLAKYGSFSSPYFTSFSIELIHLADHSRSIKVCKANSFREILPTCQSVLCSCFRCRTYGSYELCLCNNQIQIDNDCHINIFI
jgi:hypothetical protein